MLYEKIFTGIKFSFDIIELEKNFSSEVDEETEKTIFHKSDGSPHWQYYSKVGAAGIRVSRNFQLNFPNETREIIDTVLSLRDKLKSSDHKSPLVHKFLSQDLSYKKFKQVNLLKINGGVNVLPHVDPRRSLALNIGLKNSDSCRTIFSELTECNTVADFIGATEKKAFVMEDGDVYLLAVNHMHAVQNIDSTRDRYIITYTFDDDSISKDFH